MYFDIHDFCLKARSLDFGSSGQGKVEVTSLIGNGVQLLNALELVEFSDKGFQTLICEQCGIARCASGAWVTLRRLGDRLLLVPPVELLREDSFSKSEFRPPRYLLESGIPAMRQDQYAELILIAKDFPPFNHIGCLTSVEALAMHQMTAPGRLLGPVEERARLRTECFVAVSDGDLDSELCSLQSVLDRIEHGQPVTFSGTPTRVIEFHLDLPNNPTWSALAYFGDDPGLNMVGLQCPDALGQARG
jgi:hypothetical protein